MPVADASGSQTVADASGSWGHRMSKHLRAITSLFLLTLLVCCVLYPGALWLVGRVVFPTRAGGSLLAQDGEARGSRLIAQPFAKAKYFRPRPSAVDHKANAS